MIRSSPRCIIKGIGIAAALFLGFQLIFMFLMRIPEPTHTKILPMDTQNQPKQYKESEEAECKGWDCLGDREDKEFHPRDIRLPKTKPPGVKDKASDDKLQAARQADLKMIEDLHERVHEDIKKTASTDNKQDRNKADEEKLKDIVLPRGVLRSDGLKYLPNKDGHFVCLFSQDKIPYEQLNDDYCDCSDGTDEPGTSACSPYAKSRFYCTNQEAESAPIFSSRVNDGVCDCCDGSDEFEGRVVTGLAHSEKVHNSPCQDTCKALLDVAQEKELQKLEGKKRKKQYIEQGKLYNKQKQFGEDGEFYTLSESCYYKTVGKYEYTVCPFKDVYQGDDRDSTVIGKTPRWLSHDPGRHVLMMEDGSSINCPNPPRSVKIIFECGLDDEITRVEEAETCRYTVHMLTPAAC